MGLLVNGALLEEMGHSGWDPVPVHSLLLDYRRNVTSLPPVPAPCHLPCMKPCCNWSNRDEDILSLSCPSLCYQITGTVDPKS